jgi:hypothetical protein
MKKKRLDVLCNGGLIDVRGASTEGKWRFSACKRNLHRQTATHTTTGAEWIIKYVKKNSEREFEHFLWCIKQDFSQPTGWCLLQTHIHHISWRRRTGVSKAEFRGPHICALPSKTYDTCRLMLAAMPRLVTWQKHFYSAEWMTSQLVKKYAVFYRAWMFITVMTTALYKASQLVLRHDIPRIPLCNPRIALQSAMAYRYFIG